jgi:hypothetical protein
MNQQKGLTARKGGANDPAVIAAKQQPAGPAVGSQAQTAGGANELAKTGIAAGSPALAQPAAAPNPNSGSGYTGGVGNADNNPQPALNVVSRNDGVPPPEPAAAAAPGQRPGGIAFNQDAGATAAPAAETRWNSIQSRCRRNSSTCGSSRSNTQQTCNVGLFKQWW